MELSWPVANTGENLASRVRMIGAFSMLRATVERALCRRWRDPHDICAARPSVGGRLRLVLKVAKRCHVHGLPWEDLIHAGTCAISWMRAVIATSTTSSTCWRDPQARARHVLRTQKSP